MRALTLALGLTLLAVTVFASDALADQTISQGPANLTTRNTAVGDCDSNGSLQRTAELDVAADPHNRVVVGASDTCWRWDDGRGNEGDGQSLNIIAGRCGDWGCGPYASAWWSRFHNDFGAWEDTQCFSGAYASGPAVFLGCPSLDGSGPPMLPELP